MAREQDALTLQAGLQHVGWCSGKTICHALSWPERRLRDAAEASHGKVISAPGCILGYRLADPAIKDEYIREVRTRYKSQITRMEKRLAEMDEAMGFERGSWKVGT